MQREKNRVADLDEKMNGTVHRIYEFKGELKRVNQNIKKKKKSRTQSIL